MEAYIKKLMRGILSHTDDLNKYIDSLYTDESIEDNINEMLGALKKDGLITCIYADNNGRSACRTFRRSFLHHG